MSLTDTIQQPVNDKQAVDLSTAKWFKSRRSSGQGDCVEVAFVGAHTAVRDSKNRQGPALVFTKAEWNAFLDGANKGEFDRQ